MWEASPVFAPSLEGLPPAYVVTAGYDPLWDEGDAYARRLKQAGVETTMRHYPGQIHGFFTLGAQLPTADQAVTETAEYVRSALGQGGR